MSGEQWTPEMVENILIDPRVTGAGGYPQIIDDDQWLRANTKMIRQMGNRAYLKALLRAMRENTTLHQEAAAEQQ